VSEAEKWAIYRYVMDRPAKEVCVKILEDLDGLQTPILHWFGTGDCMTQDIGRISEIIETLPKYVVQMGFTRNLALWQRHKDVFAFTVESRCEADRLGAGIFSIPDYEEEISVMYSPTYSVRGGWCGPITCRDFTEEHLEHGINCQVCLKLYTGCFDRRSKA
jgi:hypothetical protein